MIRKLWISLGAILALSTSSKAQVTQEQITGSPSLNTITTAVPFLLIAPDTRAGAMGDVGVATSPDANSSHWNPAKTSFVDNDFGVSLSYTPWLRKLVGDISLSYLSFYKKVDKNQSFGGSLRYFTLGDIQFTNQFGQNTIQFRPNEFSLSINYSRRLAKKLSGGLGLRYINSNLTGGVNVQGSATKAGKAVGVDLSVYYENDDIKLGDRDAEFAWGATISNIGNKMSYSTTAQRDFIPINLRVGPRYTVQLDDYNEISLSIDFNKLLVPTPPIYARDSTGLPLFDAEGNLLVLTGSDPNRGIATGMFGSFTDAPGVPIYDTDGNPILNTDGTVQIDPGSKFKEEMREFTVGVGAEYWYDKQFAVRGGYFWEHELKGNRKYFTLGAGISYTKFNLDFSYLIPAYFGNNTQRSPLENTVRFTLAVYFDKLKSADPATSTSN